LAIPLGVMFKNQVVELVSIEKSDELTKQACISYHNPVLLFLGCRLVWLKIRSPIRRTFSIDFSKKRFGQEWLRVVINIQMQPHRLVTPFFDRRLKDKQ
jgi:hypothetical protein